jgi:Ni/Co efflux regulator RcnB
MKNSDRNFLEKAGVTALGVPAAMMAGEMARDVMDGNTGPSSIKAIKEKSKREMDAERLKAKDKDREPTGSGKESLSKERSYKKGGSVSSASKRGDGCAIKGKTRGRMV